MFRSYSKKEEVTKEDLINDPDFYSDAQQFLLERNGVTKSMSPEDTYDAFMEHMRYHNVNEVTTLRDLEYAQNASVEGKLRFASLIDNVPSKFDVDYTSIEINKDEDPAWIVFPFEEWW